MKKTAEEMKKQISLFVEYKDHDRVILSNANGDAFSSKSEDLIDFLHGIKDSQDSELPSREAELNKYIKKFAAQDQCIGFCDGFDTVYSIASPIIASHVARIKELEEALKLREIQIAELIELNLTPKP